MKKCIAFRNSPFKHDVLALITGLKSNKKPLKSLNLDNWQLVETAHYWRLFLCGTDVEGSCQAVDGDPYLNRCLMGYVNNGHVKMAAILDSDGKTIARCILKLSIIKNEDNGTEEPAIFLEDVYPEALRPLLREALIHFAIERAKAYSLPLGTMTSFPMPNDAKKDEITEVKVNDAWVCEGGMAPE